MKERRIILIANWLVLLLFLILPYTADAGVPVNAADSARLKKQALLCIQIQDKIRNKQEIRKVVKAGIQMGYDACGVIKCSIKGGGDLKQVIEGAVEAGITKDVVSRCSIDACSSVEAKDIVPLSGVYYAKAKDVPVCIQIQDQMKSNREGIREIVKTNIQSGYDACGVVRCAVKGGGEVSQVIAGAIDAGFTKNFASRCIFETCARDVAEILLLQLKQCNEEGLGYSPLEEGPGDDPRGRHRPFLSPSGF